MDRGLEAVLLDLLRKRPQGWKEFDLLQALGDLGLREFRRDSRGGALSLYRRHFQLFHALYELRDRLRGAGEADLEVHCLTTRLLAYRDRASKIPALRDGVREHYRDDRHLRAMTEEQAEAMLAEGFERIAARQRRSAALAALGLEDPVSQKRIRARFHELALCHHPDRGGDGERFSEISAAVAGLR